MALAATLLTSSASFSDSSSVSNAALLEALRRGCCVLVMRHASSPAEPPAQGATDPGNVNGERQLDAAGVAGARAMGDAFRRLGISIGRVWSSPAYRALQTVRAAALGTAEIAPELAMGAAPSAAQMRADYEAGRTAWLRRQAAEAPRPGTNTLIVTHAPNIAGAFPADSAALAEGETLVFLPDGKGAATLLARVKIEQWAELGRAP